MEHPMPTITGAYESSLAACFEGDTHTVSKLAGTPRFVSRLQAFGLIPGAQIRILRQGSAIVLQIGDTRLCLRKQDANAIRVAPFKFEYQAVGD